MLVRHRSNDRQHWEIKVVMGSLHVAFNLSVRFEVHLNIPHDLLFFFFFAVIISLGKYIQKYLLTQ